MAAVTEKPVDIKCKIEPVSHNETVAIEAQIPANHEETGQQIKTEVKQESQNRNENLPQSEDNNKDRRLSVKCEIRPDASTLYKSGTGKEHSGNGDCTADVNMIVENSVSEEVQIESESICVVEDNFLKIKKVCGDVCVDINTAEDENEDNSLVDFGGNESSLPESVNCNINDESTVCEMRPVVTKTEEEHTDFEWEKLFTPSPTNFTYPEDEKEVEKLAARLWEMRRRLLGRDLHDVITMCSFASQWKTISEESKNYVFQRMSLLYLAVTRGWRYALASSDPYSSEYTEKRPAIENFRGSYRPRKRRRMLFHFRAKAIPKQQTDQVISSQQ